MFSKQMNNKKKAQLKTVEDLSEITQTFLKYKWPVVIDTFTYISQSFVYFSQSFKYTPSFFVFEKIEICSNCHIFKKKSRKKPQT